MLFLMLVTELWDTYYDVVLHIFVSRIIFFKAHCEGQCFDKYTCASDFSELKLKAHSRSLCYSILTPAQITEHQPHGWLLCLLPNNPFARTSWAPHCSSLDFAKHLMGAGNLSHCNNREIQLVHWLTNFWNLRFLSLSAQYSVLSYIFPASTKQVSNKEKKKKSDLFIYLSCICWDRHLPPHYTTHWVIQR